MFGFVVLNKPMGVTSRRAIDLVKKCVRPIKVGHTGTLDPIAEGVLVVALGPATRLTRFVQSLPKTYTAEFQFGVCSASHDTETELVPVAGEPFQREQLDKCLQQFMGQVSQIPPEYSAVKIGGKRAYKLARCGESFEIKPKNVMIHSTEVLDFCYPRCRLKIVCGSGTYIRSIGRDLGQALQSGAVMTSLFRHAVGPFQTEEALAESEISIENIKANLLRPSEVFADSIRCVFKPAQIDRLRNGLMFGARELGLPMDCDSWIAVDADEQLLAVFERHRSGQFKPTINFVHYYAEN